MRNLKLLRCVASRIVDASGGGISFRFLAIDTLKDTVYLATDKILYGFESPGSTEPGMDLAKEGVLCDSDEIVGMEFLADLQQICVCSSNGNIIVLDPVTNQIDPVACLPSRLVASSWSPDYEILIAVTESNEILVLSRDFEIISQLALHPAEFGTDDLITVGWGKKETQFHGSEGKQAALVKNAVETSVFDWDDRRVRISWRGDGQYFSITSIDPMKGRTIRVWSREGVHCSTSEPIEGHGQCLAWKPSGSLIASSQNTVDTCRVIFYERNGLRHGEFALAFDDGLCQIRELAWNRESSILAVLLETSGKDRTYLQFYTSTNYHWCCKLSYEFGFDVRPLSIMWDPDRANTFHAAFANGALKTYVLTFAVDRQAKSENGSAMVAVVDGKNIRLTDFRKAVIPPPMYQFSVSTGTPSFVNCVTFLNDGDGLACLTDRNELLVFERDGDVLKSAPVRAELPVADDAMVYHLCHLKGRSFAYVLLEPKAGSLITVEIVGNRAELINTLWSGRAQDLFGLVSLGGSNGQLALMQESDGRFHVMTESEGVIPCPTFSKPLTSVANQVETTALDGTLYVVCLNERFQLTVNGIEISNDVNSFCLHDSFVLFTTITHQLKCLPYGCLRNGFTSKIVAESLSRNVERGSRIVAVSNEDGKVVLQMPRGNLEAIYPRALILSILKKMLDGFDYKRALLLMRRHRVNLNLIYDHSPKQFLDNIDEFVKQIDDATLLNLFISDLKNDDVTETMFAQFYGRSPASRDSKSTIKLEHVCDRLRESLRKATPSHKFCTSILMTLIKTTPPRLDTALQVVKEFRDNGVETKVIDEALQHLLYVIDANRLFDVALGTYDFDLVLMVAEKSQKDPKEFLPFLTELRSLEPSYMKYKIDIHLERWEKALVNLFESVQEGHGKFDELVDLVKKRGLYVQALRLMTSKTPEYKTISSTFADHLASQRKYDEAAISFEHAGEMEKAIECHSKSLNWKMALALARRIRMDEKRVRELCDGLANRLKDQRAFGDAAYLEYEVLKDIKRCISTLLEGALWDDAILKASELDEETHAIDALISPVLLAQCRKSLEIVEKQRTTFVQYKNRLAVVRELKRSKFKEFVEKGEIDDPMTEVSTEASSTITRSSAYSSRSTASRARRTKKLERKKYSLKEGNAYEDLGLLKELSEIVDQANQMQADVASLLRAMIRFELRDDGKRLRDEFGRFVDLIKASMSEIWPESMDLSGLPGPLEDQLADEESTAGDAINRLNGIVDSRLKIKLDQYVLPPKINLESASWNVSWFT